MSLKWQETPPGNWLLMLDGWHLVDMPNRQTPTVVTGWLIQHSRFKHLWSPQVSNAFMGVSGYPDPSGHIWGRVDFKSRSEAQAALEEAVTPIVARLRLTNGVSA